MPKALLNKRMNPALLSPLNLLCMQKMGQLPLYYKTTSRIDRRKELSNSVARSMTRKELSHLATENNSVAKSLTNFSMVYLLIFLVFIPFAIFGKLLSLLQGVLLEGGAHLQNMYLRAVVHSRGVLFRG